MWSTGRVNSLEVEPASDVKKKKNVFKTRKLYTCELEPDNPYEEGIMGTGRLFLLTAGSGGAI